MEREVGLMERLVTRWSSGMGALLALALVGMGCSGVLATGTPLTTERLRQIARQEGIQTQGVTFNRDAGRMFQGGVLGCYGLPENFRSFSSSNRRRTTSHLPKPVLAVVPDALDTIRVTVRTPGQEEPIVKLYPDSTFIEVKATRRTLHLATNRHQITGLIDAVSQSPASRARETGPGLIFATTVDTRIDLDVIRAATQRRVAVWQAVAYELPEKIDGHVAIRMGPAQILNPEVLVDKTPLPTIFTPPAPLKPGRPPSTNPDPTEVDGE